jgi:hypothetical protein
MAMRRAKPGGWYDNFQYRLRFERAAKKAFPSISTSRTGKGKKSGAIIYTLHVMVPEVNELRLITIKLRNWSRPCVQSVTADGPTKSPHRYSDGHLCMWHPSDGPELMWQPEEGLVGVIQYARVHLFREEYWRRYGTWPGPEAPHGEDAPKVTA